MHPARTPEPCGTSIFTPLNPEEMGRSQRTQRPAAAALLLGLLSAGTAAAVAGVKMPLVEAAAGEIGGMLTAVATGQHGEWRHPPKRGWVDGWVVG